MKKIALAISVLLCSARASAQTPFNGWASPMTPSYSTVTVTNLVSAGSITVSGLLSASTVQITQNGATTNVYPNTPLLMTGNINGYLQQVLQNLSNGTNASGDLSIHGDLGANTSFYLNVGVNSSRFSQTQQTAEASSSTYVASSDADLVLWADTNGGLNRPSGAGVGHVIIGSSVPVTGNIAVDISSAQVRMFGSSDTFSSSGMVNFGNQPFVSIPMAASVISGADSTLFFTAPAAGDDNWNMWGGAASSGTFTLPAGSTGRWTLQVTGSMQSASALIESIYVNGSVVALQQIQSDGNTHDYPMIRTLKLTAGDVVKFTLLQNSGSNKTTVGNVLTRSFAMLKKD